MPARADRTTVVVISITALVAIAAITVTLLARAGLGSGTAATAPEVTAAPAPPDAVAAAAVLREWDDARAAAWAAGDERALRALYVRDSAAGERDLAMLRRWSERGLRVEDMRTQLLSVEVLQRSDRRLVLRVTDRLAGAVAVRDGDGEEWSLPRDRADTQRMAFRRTSEGWLLASARAVAR